MLRIISYLVISLIAFVISPAAYADKWGLGGNSISLGIADVGWTIDEKYRGKKVLFDARFVINEGGGEINAQANEGKLKNIINVHLQIGDSSSKLDYYIFEYTFLATQKESKLKPGKMQAVRDQLEWAKLLISEDKTLGVNYNYELTLARIGRTWAYKSSNESNVTYGLGLNGSIGAAWADSVDQRYAKVSNPTTGFWNNFFIKHKKIGMFYIDSRVVAGYTFGEPKSTTSREANARFGYSKTFNQQLTLNIFGEKRSYHFAAFSIPDLYTKTKRIAVDVAYQF